MRDLLEKSNLAHSLRSGCFANAVVQGQGLGKEFWDFLHGDKLWH